MYKKRVKHVLAPITVLKYKYSRLISHNLIYVHHQNIVFFYVIGYSSTKEIMHFLLKYVLLFD
jgi:hypothetical protein